jgi:hypothetical protein
MEVNMAHEPKIHRFPEEHETAFVNAYLVETESGLVAIDSLLRVSDSRAMWAGVERIGKPLLAVLLERVDFVVARSTCRYRQTDPRSKQ